MVWILAVRWTRPGGQNVTPALAKPLPHPLPHLGVLSSTAGLAQTMPIHRIICMITTNSTSALSPNYTRMRPIGHVTSNALNTLHPAELGWIMREWNNYLGSEEDCDFNVICELVTPISKTRIWICDRDGPESSPLILLPSDY